MEFLKFRFYSNTDREYEKYVLGEWDNMHLTLRVWHERKEIDFHIKNLALPKDHPEKYFTILVIKFSELEKLTHEFGKFDFSKINILFEQKINIGKLIRKNCYLVSLSEDEEFMKRIFKISPNWRKVKFRKDVLNQDISDIFMYPENIFEREKGAFIVYQRKKGADRMNGYLYRFSHHKPREFAYVSRQFMNKFKKEVFFFSFEILKKLDFENKEWVMSQFNEMINRRFPLYKP